MTTLPSLIVSGRRLVGDAADSNLQRNESLNNPDIGNIINGTNTVFTFVNFPAVSIVQALVDGAVVAAQYYEVDFTNGIITFDVAPVSTAYLTYYFYLMNDNDWTEFVTWALQAVGASTGNPLTDVPSVQEVLLPAVKMYAASLWASRIANQTGLWYNQKLQEREEDREQISAKYTKMAENYSKEADSQRDEAYKGQGKQFQPAFAINQKTPRLYTPYR